MCAVSETARPNAVMLCMLVWGMNAKRDLTLSTTSVNSCSSTNVHSSSNVGRSRLKSNCIALGSADCYWYDLRSAADHKHKLYFALLEQRCASQLRFLQSCTSSLRMLPEVWWGCNWSSDGRVSRDIFPFLESNCFV